MGDVDHGQGNVLQFHPEQVPLQSRALARIEAYWSEIRRCRLAPSRSDIDPRGLEGVLGNAFILERLTAGLARLRIAGSHMTELIGMEARGLPLSAIFAGSSRETLADSLEAVFDEPAKVRFSLISPAGLGRRELVGHMVLLPLRSDLGDINRVLGGIEMTGTVGRAPRRLEIVGQSRQSLVGYAAEPGKTTGLSGNFTAEPARVTPRRPVVGSRRLVERAQAEGPAGRRGAHLRLVLCNDE